MHIKIPNRVKPVQSSHYYCKPRYGQRYSYANLSTKTNTKVTIKFVNLSGN